MVKEIPINLEGEYLLIATPSMTNCSNGDFIRSRQHTIDLIKKHGGDASYIVDPYCADIYLSRAKLASSFLRHPKATLMLQADDDMDWRPEDVIYMMLLKRDFLAISGPRKKYPIDFAFQLCDERSNPLPLYHEIETNVGELTHVGGAFVMTTRKCVQAVWDAHPELEFDRTETDVERAIYDPIFITPGPEWPRRRLGEDYSFCYRWAKLGGKVYCYLAGRMGHTGTHRFEGCLLEKLAEQDPNFNSPEAANG